MKEIRLDKLIRFLNGNPSYSWVKEGDKIIVNFLPPSIEEAGGQGESNKIYTIVFLIKDDKAILYSCKLTDGKEERDVTEEIDFWLEYVDMN
ncbi:hypothetical protein [Sulfuracidifex tepidarius]|uniref:Uncharacterized protein n=1 Tax=Sulfuracidifex tepidarius TaxID=1294262 RepID=A0A510DZ38_9CREN|nr:hypothetical protein [Sulfuracidifex tepidarius]BBG22725.1 hypothetical protein IC006_0009 [Sulfuracidifex tepidarius]BBG25504.1 hypothetical protein IC007_0009 [Sulfuracidifex tepidarius]